MNSKLFDIFMSRAFAGIISKAILLGCSGLVNDEGNNNYSISDAKGEKLYEIFLDPEQLSSKFNIILKSCEQFECYSYKSAPKYLYSVITTETVYAKYNTHPMFAFAGKIITEDRTIYNFTKLINIEGRLDEDMDIRLYTEPECYYCVKSQRIFMSTLVQKLINIPYLQNGASIPYESAIQILAGLSILASTR